MAIRLLSRKKSLTAGASPLKVVGGKLSLTIEEMHTMTTMLETTTQEKINALLQESKQNFDEQFFWRDVRSGYRQAESALTALRLIEEGREWT